MLSTKATKLGLVWGARLLATQTSKTSDLKTGLQNFFKPDLQQLQAAQPVTLVAAEDIKKGIDNLCKQQSEAVFFSIEDPDLSHAVGIEPFGPR